ncbi:hypothetical protein VMCG_01143 [Cytospora schulzeri]|uniref:Uncharacterized protein n=1 Tax=Cytospora schulzeri TaxID=448051 RepID=A0A423X6E1_9PEZI|nr:hypothetical protein VMCG_01143 [Valsa malicola]
MAPPTIQVTRVNGASPSHSKMIISPPRINLRRAASYNHADRGPLSSTSSRFGFDHLVFNSPPPSPGLPLPQQAPRMRKPSANPRPSRVFRLLLWLAGTVLILYLATQSIRQGQVVPVIGWSRASDEEYEMVGQDDLPDFPTPIVATDRRGRAKWTVSIPPSYEFPLTVKEYSDVCAKCKEVSSRVNKLHSHSPAALNQIGLIGGESGIDRNFVDVKEAEEQGFLPGSVGTAVRRVGDLLGVDGNSLTQKPVCTTSLTYVLESEDAGLGKTLMSLWMAYGLAKREGRSFFIDDRRWAYGEYTSMFDAPPAPDCQPPRPHEMIPCPRQARHLVVSAANVRDIFGSKISDEDIYSEGDLAGLDHRPAQRELFALAREGYEALFRLNQQDREYVFNRVIEHRIKTYAVEGETHNGRIVGIHVRHGDRHPLEFQYADSYIPLSNFVDAAHAALNDSLGHGGHDGIARDKSFFMLASDDPLVYDAGEFGGATRAQGQIRLAGKEDINPSPARPDKTVMHKFVDETFGWEGGFFAAMFWNLGLPAQAAAANNAAGNSNNNNNNNPAPGGPETIRLRSLVGRAYLMDLAVLADVSSGGVVCAVSAMGCRLLAVMMGQERAFGRGEWRNVDGQFGWTGVTWA